MLSSHCGPGHFLQPGQGIVKKGLEGCTIVIGVPACPVPLAAAPANGEIAAASAGLRTQRAFPDKPAAGRGGEGLLHRQFPDAADFPGIQHIEITGIQTAVAFHHQIASAGAGSGAGAGRKTHQNSQVVVEGADADVVSGLPVPVPAVKQGAEEFSVGLRL